MFKIHVLNVTDQHASMCYLYSSLFLEREKKASGYYPQTYSLNA